MSKRPSKIRLLFTGGGTGGHVQPALAVAEEVLCSESSTAIWFVGAGSPERELIGERFRFIRIPAVGMPSLLSFSFIRFSALIVAGVLHCAFRLLFIRPHAVFSTGGFAAAPATLAAALLSRLRVLGRRIPIYLFEPNAEPGRMNRLVARWADRIAVVDEYARTSLNGANVAVDGYPIRWRFAAVDRAEARARLGLPVDAKVILAFGGSMGARTLNRAIVEAWLQLRDDPALYLVHAVGRRAGPDYHAVSDTESLAQRLNVAGDERYRRVPTFEDMSLPFYACDLVVTRAGAGTIAEISAFGIPAVLVPKANLPGDHQAANAMMMKQTGAAEVVFERSSIAPDGSLYEAVAVDELVAVVSRLLNDDGERARLREHARARTVGDARAAIARRLLAMARREAIADESIKSGYHSNDSPLASPVGLSASVLRSRLERSLGYSWNDLLPARVLDNSAKELPTAELRAQIPLLEYYLYRGNALLASSQWAACNEGIKIAALCSDRSALPIFHRWIRDREPAPRWQRWLGGDFRTVGFLRRNAVVALAAFECWDDESFTSLLMALDDPYWEVRTAAMRVAMRAPEAASEFRISLANQIITRLPSEQHYEARAATWLALSVIAPDLPPEAVIRDDLTHPNDLVRTALMLALERFERRGIPLSERFADEVRRDLLLTSSQFVPDFLLRRAAARFHAAYEERK